MGYAAGARRQRIRAPAIRKVKKNYLARTSPTCYGLYTIAPGLTGIRINHSTSLIHAFHTARRTIMVEFETAKPWQFSLFVLVLFFAGPVGAHAQSAVVRGFVTDDSRGESLPGANVVLENVAGEIFGVAADNDGFYAIARLQAGRYVFAASYVGFISYVDTLHLDTGQILALNVALMPSTEELDEVVVDAERTAGIAKILAGLQTVLPAEIDRIPSPDITGDLANYLTVLPGFISIGDQGGQFFIRGGEPWQNLVLLDGMLVYQPFHILGFFSAFPTDILNSVDIYAGGFGARYGGRISSVIDVTSRYGNKKRYAGTATISPFVIGATAEGPLDDEEKFSFLTSFRYSVIEEGASRLINRSVPFKFNDLFVKIHGAVNRNARLSLTLLKTYDRGKIGQDVGLTPLAEVRWRNEAYGARYLVLPGAMPVLAEFKIGMSKITSELGPGEAPIRSSSTSRVNTSADLTFYGGIVDVRWGLFARTLNIKSELGGLFQNLAINSEWVTEVGIYAEPVFKPMRDLHVAPSLRIHNFPSKRVFYIEPRIRASWERGRHRLSGAMGIYHQEIVGVSDRRDATSVFTAWAAVPDLSDIPEAVHLILGYNIQITPGLDIAIEGYRKWFSNLFIAEWTAHPRLTTGIQPADGRVVGMDIRLEYRSHNLYGHVSYGLSSVEYDAQQAALELWFGTAEFRFRPAHDRRHQLNVLASTSVRGFDLTARWQFGSGLPYNRALGFDGFILLDGAVDVFNEAGGRRVIYEKPFNGVLPTYHRLDLSLERTFEVPGAALTLKGSLINAYNRSNIFYLDVFTLRRADQLPFIPSIGLKITVE